MAPVPPRGRFADWAAPAGVLYRPGPRPISIGEADGVAFLNDRKDWEAEKEVGCRAAAPPKPLLR